jgi:hypothetical protein
MILGIRGGASRLVLMERKNQIKEVRVCHIEKVAVVL